MHYVNKKKKEWGKKKAERKRTKRVKNDDLGGGSLHCTKSYKNPGYWNVKVAEKLGISIHGTPGWAETIADLLEGFLVEPGSENG